MTEEEVPKVTMLDDIRADLAERANTPGIVNAAQLMAERFCLPPEDVRPWLLALALQLSVATDTEFMADPTSMLRRIENMGYNVARAAVAAEAVGWNIAGEMPGNFLEVFGGYGTITEFCAQVTKGAQPDEVQTDEEIEH